jgi:hypothetical protein
MEYLKYQLSTTTDEDGKFLWSSEKEHLINLMNLFLKILLHFTF